jgi:hypothetical protein
MNCSTLVVCASPENRTPPLLAARSSACEARYLVHAQYACDLHWVITLPAVALSAANSAVVSWRT